MAITMKHNGWSDDSKLEFKDAESAAIAAGEMNKLNPESIAFMENHPTLQNIFLDPTLTKHQKKLKALPIIGNLRKKKIDLEKELKIQQGIIERQKNIQTAAEELFEWLEQPFFKLEKNDCSRLHKLVNEANQETIEFLGGSEEKKKNVSNLFSDLEVHSFVVQHDWAAAFKNAKDYDSGEINLPYPVCAFEFRISGKNIIVHAVQADIEGVKKLVLSPFIESNGIWFNHEEKAQQEKPFQLAWEEIKAICIALEADAATEEVIRASHALNKKRIEENRVPLFDYHIVGLKAHRSSKFDGGGTHRSPRLHFRRGHWRHYPTHKSWIKWMLVGNPDLGFVDKEYRL